ncbi:MAG: DUF6463 family protein [Bacteroidales bacterium]|nr:DUF6463 family protein [Bacteroidales bacterium]
MTTSILHTLTVRTIGGNVFWEMFRVSMFNSVEGDPVRSFLFYFLIIGIVFLSGV